MDTLHKGHRERLRKKALRNGLESLESHEVLELLLFYAIPRRDTNPIAHQIMNKYKGDLSRVFGADMDELKKIDGVGDNAAFLIHMIPQFARIINSSKWEKGTTLGTSDEMGEFALDLCTGLKRECFCIACLNSNRKLQTYDIMEYGTVNEVNLYVRKVVEYAIKENAVNIVLIHNHPNDSLLPSTADKRNTKTIIGALAPLGITVVDHIIVSKDTFYSMHAMGDI